MTERNEEIVRGEDARRLAENPLFKEAVVKVREGIVNAMERSGLGDEKTHNRLVISLQLLNQIEREIQDVIQTGRMAQLQVDQGLMERVRKFAGY